MTSEQQPHPETERLFKLVAKILGTRPEKISEDTGIGLHPKWDSLGHMKIILAIEEEFEIHFSPNEMHELFNIRNILEKIQS